MTIEDSQPGISSLSLEDSVALTTGADFWTTAAVGDVPAIVLTDGPHGIRKQEGAADHLGLSDSVPATCFPPAVALAQAWDPELVQRVGRALGVEARASGVSVLLGPGINIKRDPRCGRNFEYFSEDPLLTGVLGEAWVRGVQGSGVGASLKHFAVNNAETDRMRVSADVGPRAMREIYLRAFERIVRRAEPWTVMCSYNRINGVLASENGWLLTDVLRDEWGFEGAVVSDWGAVRDRVSSLAAGLDLEMPSTAATTNAAVVDAVRSGALDRAVVDRAADRVARLARRAGAAGPGGAVFDRDTHHALAREAAGRSIVLLSNPDGLLPLNRDASVAVIGVPALHPRYQGGGSSHVNATRVDTALGEIAALLGASVPFAAGYTVDGSGDPAELRDEAVEAASAASAAVVFLGLPEHEETEGLDRVHIDLPAAQLQLLRDVTAAQPRTAVILSHGGIVDLGEVLHRASAVLDGALLGQAGGGAIADVLFGDVNPSARVAETVPLRLQDAPAYLSFSGEQGHITYGEGVFVGYRHYDARDLQVAVPFGHGLSYTTFDYSGLRLRNEGSTVTVTVTVTNSGARRGRDVVQVYAGLAASRVARAPRALGGFGEITLDPGESGQVLIDVALADLAYWDVRVGQWAVEGGTYEIAVGASSRDIRLADSVVVTSTTLDHPFTMESTLGELMSDPDVGSLVRELVGTRLPTGGSGDAGIAENFLRMAAALPVDRLPAFTGGTVDRLQVEQLVDGVNALKQR